MVGRGSNKIEERRVIDATIGGLVWVRRRNGSWWPGQIVGLDEVPENDLASPRSGTAIKLLGRDDSSVELHDLETTKGVKAFRCGDYDSCIEKAKASAATILKRSFKYPRRENAIICALEIERTRPLSNILDLQSPSNNSEGPPNHAERSAAMSSSEETSSSCKENSYSTHELSHSGISYEETNGFTCKGKPFKGKRRKTPNDSDDDGSEGIKRMKGLDDLGIGAHKKVQVLALANPIPQSKALLDNFHDADSVSLGNVANGGSVPTLKKKRTQVVHIHELLKRKYRRRPLTKVLENTTMVPVRIICDEFATPFERSDAISPSYECENSNKVKDAELFKEHLLGDDSSYKLFDVPFVDEELRSSGYSPIWQPASPSKPYITSRGGPNQNIQFQPSSFVHEEHNESCPINSTVACVNQKMEKGASKWQSKGKRKARHLSKTEQTSQKKAADVDHRNSDDHSNGLEDTAQCSPTANGLLNGFTDRRKQISITSSPRSFSYHQPRFFVHSAFEMPDISPRSIYHDSSLYEVEISVEATRPQAQQVPYISLMSKLNGKPITGHPVSVEVLDDGFCDLQISDYPASGSCELDEDEIDMGVAAQPKASHRTKHIILRPSFKKSFKSKKKQKKKKKKLKSRSKSSSKKTRKLSSLTGPQKLNPEKRKAVVQNPKGPTLACVPLKIVFSRINEALNGSTRSALRVATLNNT